MRKKMLLACFALILALSLTVHIASANIPPQTCTGTFQGNVTRGPDAGTVLEGTITLSVDSNGDISGALVDSSDSSVNISGNFHAPAIHLRFDLPDGEVKGVGKLPGGFTPCTSNFGGHFTGPGDGDHGDWGIIWGS